MRNFATFLAASMILGSPAAAQDGDPVDRQEAMQACVALESDAARLACFDAVMSGSTEVEEEVREARVQESRENFGLSETQVRERGGLSESEVEIVVNSTVTAVRKEPRGAITFALANGQVWRTTSAGNMRYELKRGDQVSLSEGLLGSYRARVEGRLGVLGVRRIR